MSGTFRARSGQRFDADAIRARFTGRDLPSLLRDRVTAHASRTFLVWEPSSAQAESWTYARFLEDVEAVAAALADLGVRQGDRVLLHLSNCPQFLVAWHACATIGAAAVLGNVRWTTEELRYCVTLTRAKGAVTEARWFETVIKTEHRFEWIAIAGKESLALDPKVVMFESLGRGGTHVVSRTPDPLLPISIQFTSGTTSRPKGVIWTHANALWGAEITALQFALTHEDIGLTYLPLYHTNALVYSHLSTLWAGGTMVLVREFSPERFWDVSIRYACTWTNAIDFVLRHLQSFPVPKEHVFRFWGTSSCSLPLCGERYRVKSVGYWGMTEVVACAISGDTRRRNRPLTVGRPSAAYVMAVVDSLGVNVRLGTTGKLLVRGVPGISLFAGYLEEAGGVGSPVTADGWFDTGDLVTPLKYGWMRFEGREKDLLRVGGENVAAAEIERVISSIPGVIEAAVVGKPDELLGEVPVAFIVASRTLGLRQEIVTACKEQLADFKRPRSIVMLDTLPRSTLNKILKSELRRFLGVNQDRRA